MMTKTNKICYVVIQSLEVTPENHIPMGAKKMNPEIDTPRSMGYDMVRS